MHKGRSRSVHRVLQPCNGKESKSGGQLLEIVLVRTLGAVENVFAHVGGCCLGAGVCVRIGHTGTLASIAYFDSVPEIDEGGAGGGEEDIP